MRFNRSIPLSRLIVSRLFLSCILLLILSVESGAASPPASPPEENATYQVRWSFVVGGYVDIATEQQGELAGQAVRHFSLTARTLPLIDVFYKVRDRIDSYTDVALSRSLLYTKVQRGKRKKDVSVHFDWQNKTAQYRNDDSKEESVVLEEGTFDPLSAYFFIRQLDLKVGDVIFRPVSDGKKLVQGKATVLDRQRIRVPAGSFDTYLVEPDMQEVRGVFEKSKNARLLVWLTADSRHLLVKAESRVVVGSIVAELVSYSGKDGP